MKKIFKIFLSILVVVLAITVWQISQPTSRDHNNFSPTQKTRTDVIMSVIIPNGEDRIISQAYQAGQTAFDLLVDSGLAVEYDKYNFGFLVTSINGIKGGIDNKYWIYYINNEPAKVGVSNYILKPGDSIKWQFEDEKKGL